MPTTARRLAVTFALPILVAAVSPGCASAPTSTGTIPVPRPFPAPHGGPPSDAAAGLPTLPPPSSGLDAYSLVGTALGYRGTPYKFGGSNPATGFDCSGFTQYIFGQYGVDLPREVADQFHVGAPVARQNLQPGDLVFFSTDAPGASHVAIAIGAGQFVHAPSTRGVVRVENLNSSYWRRRFVGGRRVGAVAN